MASLIKIKDTIINLDQVVSIYLHEDRISFVTTANHNLAGAVQTIGTKKFHDIPSALTEEELETVKKMLKRKSESVLEKPAPTPIPSGPKLRELKGGWW